MATLNPGVRGGRGLQRGRNGGRNGQNNRAAQRRAQQLGQLEVRLKGLQVRQKIDDTSQQRVESQLSQDIQRTFGGLGGGR